MRFFSDIPYASHSSNLLDLYIPDCDSFPVFIHFHGGGLEFGDKGSEAEPFVEAAYLAERGIAVASVDYRLYPEAAYPDFIVDCAEAVSWITKNISNYGKCKDIFIGGTSAGGYISMMLCFDSQWLSSCAVDTACIKGYIHNAPQPTVHFNVLKERGMDTRKLVIDEAAPLYHISGDASYPPMKFIVSDNDIPCRYEQIMLTLATLNAFGHDMKKIDHIVIPGTHTSFISRYDENGDSIFGKIIKDFIERFS